MQRKKSNTSIAIRKNLKLSIQFSLDGFSFCIKDIEDKKVFFFKEHEFQKRLKSPIHLLDEVSSIFKSDKNLQLDFKIVKVIHENILNTLVPKEYFDENQLKNYLNFNIKTLKTDFVAFDKLNQIEANNVYIPYVNINNYLFQHFGEFEFQHHLSVFIDKILTISPLDNKKRMYVNVSKNTYDLVVIENKKLLLTNIFTFESNEDFLYYILFTIEQLNLDTKKVVLSFTGKIHKDSELYHLCYKYIENIEFLESKKSIFEDLELPKHTNFILLH